MWQLRLTDRERLALQKLAKGETRLAVAQELSVTTSGLTRIVRKAMEIYGAINTMNLIHLATVAGDLEEVEREPLVCSVCGSGGPCQRPLCVGGDPWPRIHRA